VNQWRGLSSPTAPVSAVLHLVRFIPCCVAGLLGVVGYMTQSSARSLLSPRAAIMFTSVFMTCASANVFNDIHDQRADSVQHPGRPLPSGRISGRTAWLIFVLVTVAALGFSLILGRAVALAVLCVIVISLLYSLFIKGTVLLGNIVVAGCSAAALLIGAIGARGVSIYVLLTYVLIALFMLSFEIAKTIRDRDGDELAGYRTVAVVYGLRKSVISLRLCMMLLTLTGLSLFYLRNVWLWGLFPVLGSVLPSDLVALRIPLNPTPGDIATALKRMRLSWLPGMIMIGVWLWQVRG
jgi:geranylgeranylglycerol-phosphate geranylgeranyltransferase